MRNKQDIDTGGAGQRQGGDAFTGGQGQIERHQKRAAGSPEFNRQRARRRNGRSPRGGSAASPSGLEISMGESRSIWPASTPPMDGRRDCSAWRRHRPSDRQSIGLNHERSEARAAPPSYPPAARALEGTRDCSTAPSLTANSPSSWENLRPSSSESVHSLER
jgi:hypothetical protein